LGIDPDDARAASARARTGSEREDIMAERAPTGEHLYSTEHGTRTEKISPTDYVPGHMDISEQKRTFEGFVKFWIYLAGATAAILIFLAIFVA
jgi:hypothetical protein